MSGHGANGAGDSVVQVLLIEDNPGDVHLILEALRTVPLASHVEVVVNGEEALDYIHGKGEFTSATSPDLVLLDLNLPRRDGLEVLAALREDSETRFVPVVVLTSSDRPDDVDRAYELNANCYVTKPLDADEFVQSVRQISDFWMRLATLPRRDA